jgi:hypothetical protein
MPIQVNDINVIDDDRNIIASGIATIGSGSSATTINGATGVVNVGAGITMDGISGNISIAGTITAGGIDFPLSVVSFSPTDGATSVAINPLITVAFNQVIEKATTGIGSTANITFRNSSGIGTVLQTIGVNSTSVSVTGSIVTIEPLSNLPFDTDVYVVIDEKAFTSTGGDSLLIDTYNFTTVPLALGDSYEGGFLICKASPLRWVVTPYSAEVSRTWYCRNDANTRAQQVSGCSGWFVPSCGQLQNPGFMCRTFWDSFSSTCYWSSTENPDNGYDAFRVNMATGGAPGGCCNNLKTCTSCVRSFRCVTY